MNFEDNFTCFSWLLNFISSTVIQDELRQNQIISVKEKASLMTTPTQIKTLREGRMLQVLLLLLPLLLSLSIQIFNRKFNNSSHLLPYKNKSDPSRNTVWPVRRGKENKRKSWKTSLATGENQDAYSCYRLFSKPTLVYS